MMTYGGGHCSNDFLRSDGLLFGAIGHMAIRHKNDIVTWCHNYLPTTIPLPAYYQIITSLSPTHYQPITKTLPTHYQPITSQLRANYQSITSQLPAHQMISFLYCLDSKSCPGIRKGWADGW
jgi:hypothetical protein